MPPNDDTQEYANHCPMLDTWAKSRIGLNREIAAIRRNLKVCEACEASQGPCTRVDCIKSDLSQALNTVLAELAPTIP